MIVVEKIIRKIVKIALIMLLTGTLASSVAIASGSSGGGASGGSSPPAGGGGENKYTGDRGPVSYDVGKKLFAETVVCSSCPYADLELEPEQVSASWESLRKDLMPSGIIGKELMWSQRKSIRVFVKKRFEIDD